MTHPLLEEGMSHHRAGRLDLAEAAYRRVLAATPEDPDALQLLGLVALACDHAEAAIDLIGRAVALAPHVLLYRGNLADAHLAHGQRLREQGQRQQAIAQAEAAARLRPDDERAWLLLGDAAMDLGLFQSAADALGRANAMMEKPLPLQARLGLALLRSGQAAEAVTPLRAALAADPGDDELAAHLGLALAGAGQEAEALALLETVGGPHSLLALGGIHFGAERFAEATHAYAGMGSTPEAEVNLSLSVRFWLRDLLTAGRTEEALGVARDHRSALASHPIRPQVATIAPSTYHKGEPPMPRHLKGAVLLPQEWLAVTEDGQLLARDTINYNLAILTKAIVPDQGPGLALIPELQHHLPPGDHLLLGGNGNYWHWMFDYLPRMRVLEDNPQLGPLPLIVAEGLAAYQRDSLARLAVDPGRVVEVPADCALYCPSVLVPPIAPNSVDPGAVDWLRRRFAPKPSRHGRRLLLSRNDASTRRLANEDAVMEALAPLGVERILPGELTLARQMELAAESSLIIGVHGASLANIIFMPPTGAVLELIPASESLQNLVLHLAQGLGLRFDRLIGPVIQHPEQALLHDQYKDFVLPPDDVAQAVRTLL